MADSRPTHERDFGSRDMPKSASPFVEEREWATIPIHAYVDVVIARIKTRLAARTAGFVHSDIETVAIAVSEIAQNIVDHADAGEVRLIVRWVGNSSALIVIARDHGPGIRDVEEAMRDGYSTTGGLGFGMSSAKRLMDRFLVESVVGVGTTVTMHKWARHP